MDRKNFARSVNKEPRLVLAALQDHYQLESTGNYPFHGEVS